MVITAIRSTANPNFCIVSVDNESIGKLNLNDILELKLKENSQISSELLAKITDRVNFNKYYQLAINYSLLGLRSRLKYRQYLIRKKCPDQYLDQIISQLEKLNLINDRLLASSFVRKSMSSKHLGSQKLKMKLQSEHIDSASIDQALQEADYDDQTQLKKLIESKMTKTNYKDKPNRFIRYLLAQGYNYQDIIRELKANNYKF